MKEDYTGDFYFPDLSKITTKSLACQEKKKRDLAEKHRDEANRIEREADYMLYEQNYRKHIKTLKPLQERDAELRRIINDPSTKKTALAKAEREFDKIDKAFWGVMKYGKFTDPKE